jgi:putative ABC transport system permease protein
MLRDILSDLLYRLRVLFQRGRVEQELDEELRFHFERQVEKNIARGMPKDEAMRQARLAFGGITQVQEECRDARGVSLVDTAMQDLRYAGRMLAKSKGFTALAIVTLALGVGANSAVFSLVHAVLWRPLPFEDPDRLVAMGDNPAPDRPPMAGFPGRPVNFLHTAQAAPSLEATAGMGFRHAILRGEGEPESLRGAMVTSNFFDVLGVKMAVGRNFSQQEQQQRAPVVVLSYALWQRRFGGRPQIVGEPIVLSDSFGDTVVTVIGVVPEDFRLQRAEDVQIWTLYSDYRLFDRSYGWDPSLTIGRMKADGDLATLTAELETIKAQILAANQAESDGGRVLVVRSLRDHFTEPFRAGLLVLLAAVGFVVLIACANLANLLLTRGIGRRHELSVRAVLGASRGRLIRQLLTESGLLAVLGGALGVFVAYAGVEFLRAIPFQRVPRLDEAAVDGMTVALTLALALAAALFSSLLPALRVSRAGLQGSLRPGSWTSGAPARRMRDAFVVVEIALAVIVVVGAGLMVNTFLRLKAADLGFQPDQVTVITDLRDGFFGRDHERRQQFYQDALAALNNLPGVESAALTNYAPIQTVYYLVDFEIPGRTLEGEESRLNGRNISPGYFHTMRIPLLRGRVFEESDHAAAPKVAILDETAARRYWPNEDPLGRKISLRYGKEWHLAEIVGIVEDVAQVGVRRAREPQLYLPYTQHAFGSVQAVLRTEAEIPTLATAIREAIRGVNREVPPPALSSIAEFLAREFGEPRFYMLLLSSFAGLALLLALVGLYGVISYGVTQRTREFGIRMALGGQRSDVVRLVLGQASWLVAAGLLIGVAGALALTRTLAHLLYEIEPTDPLTFFAVSVLLVLTALLACFVPARRATRIDPMRALRYE